MFKVKHKETGEIKNVYAIYGSMFLMWNEKEHSWCYDPMSNYGPAEITVSEDMPVEAFNNGVAWMRKNAIAKLRAMKGKAMGAARLALDEAIQAVEKMEV